MCSGINLESFFQHLFGTVKSLNITPVVRGHRFVKYVSAGAPSSRWEVLAEYKVEGAGAEEEEEEEDDASKGGSSSKA